MAERPVPALPSHATSCLLWLVVMSVACLASPPTRAGASPIPAVVNGSFEEWTKDGPVGWQLNNHPDLAGTWEQSASARTGQRAVLLRPGAKGQCHVYQWHFAVSPQTIFRAGAWVKGEGQGSLQLYTYDAKQVFNGGWPGVEVALGKDYQPVSFCYVPDRPEVAFVALVLVCSGKSGYAIFDDVTTESLSVEELNRASGHVADLAGEVKAGQWSAPAGGSVALSDGPFAAPAAVCRFAPATAPAVAFDAKSWWRQSDGGAVGGLSWAESDGPRFPLHEGVPYEVRFRYRAEDAVSLHFKLRYFDDQGAEVKVGAGECCYHQIGDTRTGSWPWRERSAVAIPPPRARAGRIEVWALPGSGPVGLADVSVRVVAANAHMEGGGPGVPAKDVPAKGARPVPVPKPPTRDAVAVNIPARAQTKVITATGSALEVVLSTGVTLRGAFEGRNFLGLGEVRLGSLLLHAPQAPPWAPLLQGDPVADYDRCELEGGSAGAPGHPDGVTLHLRLVAADGSADELEWRLWPERTRLVDLDAVGFGYSFAATSATRTFHGLTDRTVWGLAGTADGLTVETQQTYALENVFTPTRAGGSVGEGGLRFVHADPFDFQTGPEGSLVTYFERPGFVNKQPAATPWGVRVLDEFRLPWGRRIETGAKVVVFTTGRGPDAWSAARDTAYEIVRAAYGIHRETPLPMVNVSRLQYDVRPESQTELKRVADEWVPEFKTLGFRRIYLGPLWEGIVCGPDRLEIAGKFGGEAALKYLCDAAHGAGLQVIEWLCPAHLWSESSIFKAHPEYELKGPNGRPPTQYCWPTLRGVDLTTPHWDYYLKSVSGIHDRTGLDGLWLDSYCSFTHFIETADPQFPLRQGDALWRLHGALHKLGLVTYVEGCACYGIKSNGLPANMDDPESPVFPDPNTFYDTSPYTGPWYPEAEKAQAKYLGSEDHYYRYLANKSCVFIYYDAVRDVPGALDRIGQANRDYDAVVSYLERRVVLPDDRGIQWNCNGKPKVLFTFQDFELRLPNLSQAIDVTTGRKLSGLHGTLRAEKGHTYLFD